MGEANLDNRYLNIVLILELYSMNKCKCTLPTSDNEMCHFTTYILDIFTLIIVDINNMYPEVDSQ